MRFAGRARLATGDHRTHPLKSRRSGWRNLAVHTLRAEVTSPGEFASTPDHSAR
jgi:hypothetical protein